jgi:uncharacterized membrane protein
LRVKLGISRRERQYVVAFIIMMTVVYSGIAYVVLTPPRPDSFFATWVLGAKGMAADYYPNGNTTIAIGEEIKWNLGAYNHMGSLQYVVLRVKLINSTINTPNSTTGIPSPAAPILEFARVLLDNETWSIPFTWKIINLHQAGTSIAITRLSINNNTLTGEFSSASQGMNFRFLFELWFYDETTHQLTFFWTSAGDRHSAWTEIWFNATLPT